MKKNSKRFQIENNVLIRCNTDARKVVIPEEVTEIGDYAFRSCTSLTNVVLPDTVSKIGSFPFDQCKINELHSKFINITNGLCIEGNKLLYCSDRSLTNIIIPDGISEIGEKAFAGLNLRKVTIPNSVAKIGNDAFSGCARKSSSEIIGNIQIVGDFADQSLLTIVYKGSKSQWEKVEGSEQDDLKDMVVFEA